MAWNFANSRITNSACLLLSPLSCPMANRKPWNINFVNWWNENINNLLITCFYESWIYDFRILSRNLLHVLISTKCNFFFADMTIYFYRKSRICKFKIRENMWWARHKYFVFCMKKSMFKKLHKETIYLRTVFVKILTRLSLSADHCIHSYWLSRLRQASHRKKIQSSALRLKLWLGMPFQNLFRYSSF